MAANKNATNLSVWRLSRRRRSSQKEADDRSLNSPQLAGVRKNNQTCCGIKSIRFSRSNRAFLALEKDFSQMQNNNWIRSTPNSDCAVSMVLQQNNTHFEAAEKKKSIAYESGGLWWFEFFFGTAWIQLQVSRTNFARLSKTFPRLFQAINQPNMGRQVGRFLFHSPVEQFKSRPNSSPFRWPQIFSLSCLNDASERIGGGRWSGENAGACNNRLRLVGLAEGFDDSSFLRIENGQITRTFWSLSELDSLSLSLSLKTKIWTCNWSLVHSIRLIAKLKNSTFHKLPGFRLHSKLNCWAWNSFLFCFWVYCWLASKCCYTQVQQFSNFVFAWN